MSLHAERAELARVKVEVVSAQVDVILEAFWMGFDDCMDGRGSNPWPLDESPELHIAWRKGWCTAEGEAL
jgi:hypothetical protein